MRIMMNSKKSFLPLTTERQWLFYTTMEKLDPQFCAKTGLIGNEQNGYGVRTSAHYALGLLARGQKEDISRAKQVIKALLNLQFEAKKEDVYYGVFKRNDREKEPAKENFPGKYFDADARYYLDKWQELIIEKFKKHLDKEEFSREKIKLICKKLNQSVVETIPVVWQSYDPNWREFIGTIFALILSVYDELLEEDLVCEMEVAMERAVTGSIKRFCDNLHPMNTNVELMHIFICVYFGERLNRIDFLSHGINTANEFLRSYEEFHAVAEYNSPTYYSVDLMILSCWRQFTNSETLNSLGTYLEGEIWKDFAKFYNPELKNMSGPFSRGYEIDMKVHSSLPALLYLGLGGEVQEQPTSNCEDAGNIDLALLGTIIPEEIKPQLIHHQQDRQIQTKFRELIERGAPNDNTSICTATACITKNYMLGALEGSRNTSGQLRSAVAYWKAPDSTISYLSLFRREVSEMCEHMRTVLFHNSVLENNMQIEVEFELERNIELFFEVSGQDVNKAKFKKDLWELPGMKISVSSDAPEPEIRYTESGAEIVYLYDNEIEKYKKMRFQLKFEYTGEK